jgi:hypothetical protein
MMIRALTFIILLGLLVCAPGEAARQDSFLKAESLSPYIIEWFIDINEDADLKQIWRSLKIETSEEGSFRCGGNCSAETFDIETNDVENGRIVALKIFFESASFYQYLIFRKGPSDPNEGVWKLIGNIYFHGQPYGPPAHRIESGDNRNWFVLRVPWRRGPGIAAAEDQWFDIGEKGLKRVLSYPVEGRHMPCGDQLGRSYKSILLRHGSDNGVYTVPIQLLVTYNISDCARGEDSRPLLTKAHKAYYGWNDDKRRFVLDTSRSDVTEREIESVYNIEGFSNDKFVEFNFDQILNLAKGGDLYRKDWLRKFLPAIQDSPRKTALQKILQ